MKIAIRGGHQYTGEDKCAVGYVSEIDVDRRYYKLVMKKLQDLGNQVLDVTPPENNRTLSDSLYYGINKANNWGADLFVSCHIDAFETDKARGCEVVCGSQNGLNIGQKIVNELVNIGFPVHRGAYIDDRGLAEIRQTHMTAIIIEPFFCDSGADVSVYNKVGDDGIANAIVKGITGRAIENSYSTFPMNLQATGTAAIYNLNYYKDSKTGHVFQAGEKISNYNTGDKFIAYNSIPGYWLVEYGEAKMNVAVAAGNTKYVD